MPDPRGQAVPQLEERAAAAADAVIIYMMDVSGSMGDEQKEIVRIESFWIDTWLGATTRASRPLHHPRRRGQEVDETPSTTPASRAARRSVERLQAVREDHRRRVPADQWNIYAFHFSDGDNWSATTPQVHRDAEAEDPAAREPVRLRPGREPLRLRPVPQGPPRAPRRARARRHLGDRDRDAILGVDQGVPREGQVADRG